MTAFATLNHEFLSALTTGAETKLRTPASKCDDEMPLLDVVEELLDTDEGRRDRALILLILKATADGTMQRETATLAQDLLERWARAYAEHHCDALTIEARECGEFA